MKKHTIGYIRESKSGKVLNLEGKFEAIEGLQTYEGKDETKRFRISFFKEDVENFLKGKVEYIKCVQFQDEE